MFELLNTEATGTAVVLVLAGTIAGLAIRAHRVPARGLRSGLLSDPATAAAYGSNRGYGAVRLPADLSIIERSAA